MVKLQMTDSSGRIREFEIGPDPTSFGHGEDNDVVLGSRKVARHHMVIWEDGGRVMVEDLTSGKGISLDGQPIGGVFELSPSSKMEVGIFVFRLAGAEVGGATTDTFLFNSRQGPMPFLEGLAGEGEGVEVELCPGNNDIGREPSLYLVIDDPSISPRHARISVQNPAIQNARQEKGSYILSDLGSQQGTFVNEEQIQSSEIRDGDLLRFGNIEFKFHTGISEPRRGRKLRLVVIAAASALLLILILALAIGKSPPKSPSLSAPNKLSLDVQLEQYLQAARAAMEGMDWSKASQELEAALDIHPASEEARKMQKKLLGELANKKRYEDGNVMADMGKLNEGLNLLRSISKESVYNLRAKDRLAELVEKLSEEHLKKGKAQLRAERFRQAHEHFLAYMQLKPCDRGVVKEYLAPTEGKMRRRGIAFPPYANRCEAGAAPQAGTPSEAPEETAAILKKSYPAPALAEAMALYLDGKAQQAIQMLRREKQSIQDPYLRRKAEDLEDQLRVIQGRYEEGLSALLQNRWADAEKRLTFALETDAKIVPQPLRSRYRDDIGAQLAKGLHQKAGEEMNRKQWRAAFDLWRDCLKFHPADPLCTSGLADLEKIAEQYLDAAIEQERAGNTAGAQEYLRTILGITRDESSLHQKARQKLGSSD